MESKRPALDPMLSQTLVDPVHTLTKYFLRAVEFNITPVDTFPNHVFVLQQDCSNKNISRQHIG